MQDIRNEVVYGKIVFKDEATILRNKILGVTDDSILTDILKYKKKILERLYYNRFYVYAS